MLTSKIYVSLNTSTFQRITEQDKNLILQSSANIKFVGLKSRVVIEMVKTCSWPEFDTP